MKKSISSILVGSTCMVLSVSAFALPSVSAMQMKKSQNIVMQKEIPTEYMEDFSVGKGMQVIDNNKSLTAVPSQQIDKMKEEAIKKFKTEYKINIPEGFKFEHNSVNITNPDETNSIKTILIWSDGTYGTELFSMNSKFFMAEFKNDKDIFNLTTLNIKNGFSIDKFEGLIKKGNEYLKNNMYVKEDINKLDFNSQIITSFENKNKNTNVQLQWAENKVEVAPGFYSVCFDNVDFEKNTEVLTGAENFMAVNKQAKGKDFTETQKNNMLNTAKQFLNNSKIKFAELSKSPDGNNTRAYQINDTMCFTFEADGLNNTSRNFVTVYVASDMKILGFLY